MDVSMRKIAFSMAMEDLHMCEEHEAIQTARVSGYHRRDLSDAMLGPPTAGNTQGLAEDAAD